MGQDSSKPEYLDKRVYPSGNSFGVAPTQKTGGNPPYTRGVAKNPRTKPAAKVAAKVAAKPAGRTQGFDVYREMMKRQGSNVIDGKIDNQGAKYMFINDEEINKSIRENSDVVKHLDVINELYYFILHRVLLYCDVVHDFSDESRISKKDQYYGITYNVAGVSVQVKNRPPTVPIMKNVLASYDQPSARIELGGKEYAIRTISFTEHVNELNGTPVKLPFKMWTHDKQDIDDYYLMENGKVTYIYDDIYSGQRVRGPVGRLRETLNLLVPPPGNTESPTLMKYFLKMIDPTGTHVEDSWVKNFSKAQHRIMVGDINWYMTKKKAKLNLARGIGVIKYVLGSDDVLLPKETDTGYEKGREIQPSKAKTDKGHAIYRLVDYCLKRETNKIIIYLRSVHEQVTKYGEEGWGKSARSSGGGRDFPEKFYTVLELMKKNEHIYYLRNDEDTKNCSRVIREQELYITNVPFITLPDKFGKNKEDAMKSNDSKGQMILWCNQLKLIDDNKDVFNNPTINVSEHSDPAAAGTAHRKSIATLRENQKSVNEYNLWADLIDITSSASKLSAMICSLYGSLVDSRYSGLKVPITREGTPDPIKTALKKGSPFRTTLGGLKQFDEQLDAAPSPKDIVTTWNKLEADYLQPGAFELLPNSNKIKTNDFSIFDGLHSKFVPGHVLLKTKAQEYDAGGNVSGAYEENVKGISQKIPAEDIYNPKLGEYMSIYFNDTPIIKYKLTQPAPAAASAKQPMELCVKQWFKFTVEGSDLCISNGTITDPDRDKKIKANSVMGITTRMKGMENSETTGNHETLSRWSIIKTLEDYGMIAGYLSKNENLPSWQKKMWPLPVNRGDGTAINKWPSSPEDADKTEIIWYGYNVCKEPVGTSWGSILYDSSGIDYLRSALKIRVDDDGSMVFMSPFISSDIICSSMSSILCPLSIGIFSEKEIPKSSTIYEKVGLYVTRKEFINTIDDPTNQFGKHNSSKNMMSFGSDEFSAKDFLKLARPDWEMICYGTSLHKPGTLTPEQLGLKPAKKVAGQRTRKRGRPSPPTSGGVIFHELTPPGTPPRKAHYREPRTPPPTSNGKRKAHYYDRQSPHKGMRKDYDYARHSGKFGKATMTTRKVKMTATHKKLLTGLKKYRLKITKILRGKRRSLTIKEASSVLKRYLTLAKSAKKNGIPITKTYRGKRLPRTENEMKKDISVLKKLITLAKRNKVTTTRVLRGKRVRKSIKQLKSDIKKAKAKNKKAKAKNKKHVSRKK